MAKQDYYIFAEAGLARRARVVLAHGAPLPPSSGEDGDNGQDVCQEARKWLRTHRR